MKEIEFIDSLDVFEKAKIYNTYLVCNAGLRHYTPYWGELKNVSFDDFINPEKAIKFITTPCGKPSYQDSNVGIYYWYFRKDMYGGADGERNQ